MSLATSRSHALAVSSAPAQHTTLFKEDRLRRIDRFISFFGDTRAADDDVCGEALLESFPSEQWSER